MARRSPALVVLSVALIAVGGARSIETVAASFSPHKKVGGAPIASSVGAGFVAPAEPARMLVPQAETAVVATIVPTATTPGYAEMAAIYAGLPAPRAATLVAGLPTDDAARLLRAMPGASAGAVLTELDDQTAITLTLAMTQLAH